MTSASEGMDYMARNSGPGGSPRGRDQRPCPAALKLAAHRWALASIGGGDEAHFYRNWNRLQGRFTKAAFEPVVPLLFDYFPEEMEQYIGPTDRFPSREENAAYLMSQRFHKMYYGWSTSGRGRGEASKEHPKKWKSEKMSSAHGRLAEVGWPW